jgi:phage terminase large subunit-like protein
MTLFRNPPIHSSDLKAMGDGAVEQYLSAMTEKQREELLHMWEFWARPNQLEPEGKDWDYWIFNAGRGAGKTRAGAEWVRHRVKMGDKRIACVAPTKGDIRRVMVEGESGLLNVCWKGDKTYKGRPLGYPEWSPTNSKLTWENGAEAQFFSAEDPDRLRGPQFHSAWADEVAAWRNQQDVWDMLMFCLRLGRHPRAMVTTTPKPTKLMRFLLKHPKAIVSGGSTFDNADNLASTYLQAVREAYEGTRLGRQELYAEILEEAEGALWTTEVLDKALDERIKDPVEFSKTLNRVVVAVDPAITSNAESDMTGIVVAGVDVNGLGYVLEDATERLSPQGWASKVISLYHKYNADRIVAERNQGGEMVRRTIEAEDETAPIRLVHASRGKYARAEPISALYEQGKVKHAKNLDELETQMRTWEPLGSIGSPDRLDACVWALTDLMLNGVARPSLHLGYETAKGLQTGKLIYG